MAAPGLERLFDLPVERVDRNPYQPRETIDEEKLGELAQSIKAQGMIQPIVVRQVGERYQLIAGERRLLAAKLAGLETVPARVIAGGEEGDLEKALVENLQREDLNAVHEARAYQRMQEMFGLTQEQIAGRVGKSRAAVANTLRLLRLPEAIQNDLLAGRLSEGHARALLGLAGGKPQMELRNLILRDGLSVRQAEDLVKTGRLPGKPTRGGAKGSSGRDGDRIGAEASVRALEEQLALRLGARVRILARSARRGRIVIHYGSLDDFERIVSVIGLKADGG